MQIKNLTIVGIATALTRGLGFIRDMLIAAVLGSGAIADAFILAFRLPNLARRVFAEGAFNASFIPLYEKIKRRQGRDEALIYTGEIVASFMASVILLTLLSMAFLPWLFPIFLKNARDPELTMLLTRLSFPFLIFSTLAALYAALLNAEDRFLAASLAPLILNIMLVGVLLFAPSHIGIWLAVTVSVAGGLQALFLYVALLKAGLKPVLSRPKVSPRVSKAFALAIPGLIAGGLAQLNVLVGTLIAATETAAVSRLYYADRLYQLPLSVVATALGIVLLKDMIKAKDKHENHNRALELALGLGLPAACGLYFASYTIIELLFQRGAFTAFDTFETAKALAAYAWGLPFFVMIKVSSNVFFARGDTKTPMLIGLFGLAVNAIASYSLMGKMGVAGVAHATSLSGAITALILLIWLKFSPDRLFFLRVLKITFASLLMCGLLITVKLSLFIVIPLAMMLYLAVIAVLNLADFKTAWQKGA